MRGCIFSVDPGLQGTGIAFFPSSRVACPQWTSVIPRANKGDWIARARTMTLEVKALLASEVCAGKNYGRAVFVCEMMEMHQSARAQMMWKSGDFQHTLVFIGMMCHAVRKMVHEIKLVKPSEWKGQLPKPVAERRIRKIIGEEVAAELGIRSHAWDAVGIGLWQMKKF